MGQKMRRTENQLLANNWYSWHHCTRPFLERSFARNLRLVEITSPRCAVLCPHESGHLAFRSATAPLYILFLIFLGEKARVLLWLDTITAGDIPPSSSFLEVEKNCKCLVITFQACTVLREKEPLSSSQAQARCEETRNSPTMLGLYVQVGMLNLRHPIDCRQNEDLLGPPVISGANRQYFHRHKKKKTLGL